MEENKLATDSLKCPNCGSATHYRDLGYCDDSSAPNSPELTRLSGEQAEERTARECGLVHKTAFKCNQPNGHSGSCSYTSPLAHSPASCSEVVERLAKECFYEFDDKGNPRFNREYAETILHSWRERRVQELEEALRVIVEYHTIPAGYWSSRYPQLDDVVDVREGEEKPCWLQMAESVLARPYMGTRRQEK